MGQPKAALTLAHRADTFLSRLVRTFLQAAIPEVVVVTGAAEAVVRAAAGPVDRRVRFAHNANWERGQLLSLVAGLNLNAGDGAASVQSSGAGHTLEAIVVHLVDMPLVSSDTVRRVIHAWRQTRAPIVRPARGAEHGHPVIFDRVLFDALRSADPRVGAKAVVRARAKDILEVPIEDEGAFIDVDTPAEYRDLIVALSTDGPLS